MSPRATWGETPTGEEISKVLHSLANKKAPGPDNIAAELLKKGGKTAEYMTIALVQHIWETKDIPTELSRALVCLIPKKTGDRSPEAQRPISLTNTWLKIIDKLITKRLRSHLEQNHLLSDEQAGFRKGRN